MHLSVLQPSYFRCPQNKALPNNAANEVGGRNKTDDLLVPWDGLGRAPLRENCRALRGTGEDGAHQNGCAAETAGTGSLEVQGVL